jgi:acyl-CoA synthetase (AMP-forming)/AMP-acid ligase II
MRLETILRAQAQRHPDKIALICEHERLSYAELTARIARVASGLKATGLTAGDRIVVYLSNGIAAVELYYAAFSLGVIVVPVTTRLTAHELAHICADSRPSALAFEGDGNAIRSVLDANPQIARIALDAGVAGATPYASLLASAASPPPPPTIGNDDALIMYTSGTTGKPKGAIITHANIVTQHRFTNAVEWGISEQDCYLVTTPLTHRTGFARLANALTLGGTLVVMKKFDARATVETIARERITVAGMVPTVCRMLLPEIKTDPASARPCAASW